jgi:hypothetical protein
MTVKLMVTVAVCKRRNKPAVQMHNRCPVHRSADQKLVSQVSDREALLYLYNGTPALIKQAQAMIAEGHGEDILTRTWDVAGSTPVTARRYASFTVKGGDDDMFSSDLTDGELKVRPLTGCYAAWSNLPMSFASCHQ